MAHVQDEGDISSWDGAEFYLHLSATKYKLDNFTQA